MARTETATGTNAAAAHTAPNGEKKTRKPRTPKAPAAVYVMVQAYNPDGTPIHADQVKVIVAADAHAAIELQKANPGAILAFGYPAAGG